MTTRVVTIDSPTVSRKPNPGFLKHLDETSKQHAALADIVEMAVRQFNQPISAFEVAAFVNTQLSESYHPTTIRGILIDLAASGKLLSRTETLAERRVRSGGETPTGPVAALFFKPEAGEVPERTETEIVEGVVLTSTRQRAKRETKKAARRKVNKRPAPNTKSPKLTGTLETSAIDFLIEKLMQERTADLQLELAKANARAVIAETELAELKSKLTVLSKLVD
jgi:hypothetical protein